MSMKTPSLKTEEIVKRWQEFIEQYLREEIADAVSEFDEQRFEQPVGIIVEYDDVSEYDGDFADDLVSYPGKLISALESAVQREDAVPGDKEYRFDIRVRGVPITSIRETNHTQLGNLISIEGLVQQVTDPNPRYEMIAFECLRCGTITEVPQPDSKIQEPYQCDGCERDGPFNTQKGLSKYHRHQRIKIQESPEGLQGGEDPRSVKVRMEDSLVDETTPGEKVRVTGIYTHADDPEADGKEPLVKPYIEATDVNVQTESLTSSTITDEDREKIQEIASENAIEKISESIAPSIYGHEEVKRALALQMFSGVRKDVGDKTTRGDIHVLLVGDPGTAKSEMLQFVANTVPRGSYSTGESSSKAGLTAAAVQTDLGDGGWSIEAGVLVLSDNGIAAVDELDKLDSETDALHSALEQQKVNIAKAGISTTMNARCGFLAAANPKYGRWDDYEGVATQLDLPPALISRFDLIYTLKDRPDEDFDKKLAETMLDTARAGQQMERGKSIDEVDEISEPPVPFDLLPKYIAYARDAITPVIDDEAMQRMSEFYVNLRSGADSNDDGDDAIPVTARKLGAMIRLAEASARMRLSQKIEEEDVDMAMDLVTSSMDDVGVDPETGEYDADIVATGRSSTQRERLRNRMQLLESMGSEYDSGVPIEDFEEKLEEEGMDISDVEHWITKMKRDGRIYQPEIGTIRST